MTGQQDESTLRCLTLTGTPYERGVTHGDAFSAEIAHNLDTYLETFSYYGVEESAVYEMAERFVDVIADANERYFEEMQGMADASDCSLADVTVLNARYEVLYGAWHSEAETLADGCTAFAARPEITASGHTIIGQNWDWLAPLETFVMEIRRDGGPDMLAMTEAGIVGGKVGFNEHGIGMLLNGLVTADDGEDPFRTPYHVRFREVLDAARFDNAIGALLTENRACSANVLLGHAAGELIDLELGPTTANHIFPDDDTHLLTHANHLEGPEMESRLEIRSPDTLCRSNRLRRLLLREGSELSVEAAQAVLQDHFGRPKSICRHPDETEDEADRTQTKGSFVIDLTERRLVGTDGPPCEREYVELQL